MIDRPPNPRSTTACLDTAAIDASCRAPLLVLFAGAVVWLVAASAFGLMASIKFHSPDFLADTAGLTYGRIHPAAVNALLYGFAMQAGLGVALWMIARLGGSRVSQPWLTAVGATLWNVGVLAGVVGILAGDSSGLENLEMPRYAALILFLSYLIIGSWTLLTLRDRTVKRMVPAHWFLLAALFWFPWVYSTANLLLQVFPVRGVNQAIIDWWYSDNLTFVWLGLVGLAVIFRFVPAFAGRTLHSEHLALLTFWTLVLFGSWGGIPDTAPVPAWMPAVSCVARILTVVTLISVGVNIYKTKHGIRPRSIERIRRSGSEDAAGSQPAIQQTASLRYERSADCQSAVSPVLRSSTAEGGRTGSPLDRDFVTGPGPSPGAKSGVAPWFIYFGLGMFQLAGAMRIAGALPGISPVTHFTWFIAAQSQLTVYGFFAMTMFGAIYHIAPRVAGVEWPLPRALRWHFGCAVAGVLLSALPLAAGGVVQGIRLNDPQVAFSDLARGTLPYLRVSTLGELLIAIGHLLLAVNLAGLSIRYCRVHFTPVFKWIKAEMRPVEVKP